ncbi:Lysophosphatidic acid phosphatase type 6 [Binucleata daphniae]
MFKVSDTPIPINIGRRGIKSLYSSKYCESYQNEKEYCTKKTNENNKKNLNTIREYIEKSYPILNFYSNPYEVFDIVKSSLGNGHSYFKNFSGDILKMVENYAVQRYFDIFYNKKFLVIYKGEVIKDLHDQITKATQNMTNKKMYVLSAHDVTIYPLLMAFGIENNRWPDFGANLIFETYKDKNDEHYVKAKYMGNAVAIPGCGKTYKNDKTLCSINDFLRICKEYIPVDKEILCRV